VSLRPLSALSRVRERQGRGNRAQCAERSICRREDRDSNPGAGCPANGFQDRRLRPLGHPPDGNLAAQMPPTAGQMAARSRQVAASYFPKTSSSASAATCDIVGITWL
jgi:hypothetical protein